MDFVKKNYCCVFATAALIMGISLQAHAESSADICAQLTAKLTFAHLEVLAENSTHHASVRAPHWFKVALPEDMNFISKPLLARAPNLVHKEFGGLFVGLHGHIPYGGTHYDMNIGLNPEALVDNIFRWQRGEPKTLVPDSARAAGLFTHGGGVPTANMSNGSNAASQLISHEIATVAYDFWGHGINLPKSYSERPNDYVEFTPWFMHRYMRGNVPLFKFGHSMGGQVANLAHLYLTPAYIEANYPGLRFGGAALISAPTDPTFGAGLYTKISADNGDADPAVQLAMFDRGLISVRAPEPMADLSFLDSWNKERLEGVEYPAISLMGDRDEVCYLGNQAAYHQGITQRKNMTSIVYSDLVDHKGESTPADHFIVKHFKRGHLETPGVNNGTPAPYADIITFVEQKLIGNKDYDPTKTKAQTSQTPVQANESAQVEALLNWRQSQNQSISRAEALKIVQENNARRAYKGALSRVLGLYAKNLVFRQFVTNYTFTRKVLISETMGRDLNTFISGIDRFASEAQRYEKHLTNPRVPVDDPEKWTTFFNWIKHPETADRSAALSLFREWGSSDNGAHAFPAAMLARTLDLELPPTRFVDMPAEFPVRLDTIIASLQGGQPLSQNLREVALHRNIILGFRDLDINALTNVYPELRTLASEKTSIYAEHRALLGVRNKLQLPKLTTLYAQHMQIVKLLAKDKAPALTAKGAQLDAMITTMRRDDTATVTHGFNETLEKYHSMVAQGWKEEAFESYLGPELRILFSGLNSKLIEIDGLRKSKKINPQKIVDAEDAFTNIWNEGLDEIHRSANLIQGAGRFERAESESLNSVTADVQQLRAEALELLNEFFTVRDTFIRENEHLWSRESRPSYPRRYYDLITAYEGKQSEFQMAKQRYDAELRRIAPTGELGPYVQFIYAKLDELELSIARINGKEEGDTRATVATDESLTTIESRLQEIEMRLEEIESYTIANYTPTLYRTESTTAWSAFDNPNEMPSMDQINKILDAWNRVWRDPTGGQVQESAAY